MKEIMRPYQIEAFKWLRVLHKYNFGGVLADDMGLGKTLETIALLDSVNSNLPSIIISPKSLIYNWEKELLKWPTTLIPYVINGNKGERKDILNDNFKPGVVFIISYDTLRNDLDMFDNKTFNYAILDEAQAIKNMQALKTKSVKKIMAEHRLVLTGTPIENSVADLWSIFDFLMPNYLFNYDRFRLEIEKGVLMNDDEAYNRIILKTKPFILRRKKKDVLKDLPDKIEETISISMSSEQRKLYDAYLLQVRKALTMKDNTNKITILAMLTRLRQICISPSLVVDGYIESEKINYTCTYKGQKSGKTLSINVFENNEGEIIKNVTYPDGMRQTLSSGIILDEDCSEDIYYVYNKRSINFTADTSDKVSNNTTLFNVCRDHDEKQIEHFCSGECKYEEMTCSGVTNSISSGSGNSNSNSDGCYGLLPIIKFIRRGVFTIIQIGIPILLIIMGTLDLAKAVISSDEQEIKKATGKFIKRVIYAIAVFFVVTIVTLIMNLVANNTTEENEDANKDWRDCWDAAG